MYGWYLSLWLDLWLNYLEIPWNPSRQPYAMGSGDRITSYGCDGSVSSHLVRLKGLGPCPNHGILCALLNDPNFCWKAKQYQSKHPNSWDKTSKQTHKATCSAWTIQARGVLIRNLRCAKQDATSVYSNRNNLPTSSASKATSQAKFIAISSHWQGPQAATSQPNASPLVPLVISPVNQISTKASHTWSSPNTYRNYLVIENPLRTYLWNDCSNLRGK